MGKRFKKLSYGHQYGAKCIDTWLWKEKRCPTKATAQRDTVALRATMAMLDSVLPVATLETMDPLSPPEEWAKADDRFAAL